MTAAVGYAVGGQGSFDPSAFLVFLAGTALLCGGASTLNQYMERDADARMVRTSRRPVPAGRLRPEEALVFGLALSAAGLLILSFVNLLTVALGAASLLSYVLAYTPLKRVTSLCTVVGAVPGALPPLMGWAAARGELGAAGWGLFAILFLWQLPHFLAIGWLYRDDYARGGFPMLAVTDPDGSASGRQALLYAAALLPVTLAAGLLAAAGSELPLGRARDGRRVPGLRRAVRLEAVGPQRARRLFLVSVLYLPALLGLMVFDR